MLLASKQKQRELTKDEYFQVGHQVQSSGMGKLRNCTNYLANGEDFIYVFVTGIYLILFIS